MPYSIVEATVSLYDPYFALLPLVAEITDWGNGKLALKDGVVLLEDDEGGTKLLLTDEYRELFP